MTGNVSVCSNESSDLLYDTIASYQEAIIDVLANKFSNAIQEFNVATAVLCGGVACNNALRIRITEFVQDKLNVNLLLASPKFCTDNAAMIAGLGYHYYRASLFDDECLDAFSRLPSQNMSIPLSLLSL
jgi:N6-L-threonylcarbamoyladenine synthase